MADFGIKADIPLGVVGVKRTPLSETIGTATKAMEFSRLSELYPELIKKTTAEAKTAQVGAEKATMGLNVDKATQIANGQVSMIINPMVVAAANGQPVDKNKLAFAVEENAKLQAKNAGIDWETQGKALAAPYIERAINAPETLRDFYKERMLIGLDDAARAEQLTPKMVTQGFPQPVTITPAEGIARELRVMEPGAVATQGVPASGQPPSQRNVIADQLTQPIGQPRNPGFQLNFAPRSPNSIQPVTEPEQAAINEGRKFREIAAEFSDQGPGVIDRVDRVLQTVSNIESSREFKAGKAGELEARLRQALGEAEYKLLQKELADLVIQTNQVTGGKTDAATALVAQSTGDISYPPGVLKNVVTKLRGDAYGAMMKAQGAQAFINNGFGEANLRNYRDAWNKNADPRVFEAMAIFGSDRLTADQKKAAFNKIKPTNLESLDAFERKYKNLESLARTGALPQPKRPAR
jgi:hypothetical protein